MIRLWQIDFGQPSRYKWLIHRSACWAAWMEFGRTPGLELRGGGNTGRDHHPNGFTIWMARAGLKQGHGHGATGELGDHAIDDGHYVTDLHAAVLHLPGWITAARKSLAAEASTFGLSYTEVPVGQDLESRWLAIIAPAAEPPPWEVTCAFGMPGRLPRIDFGQMRLTIAGTLVKHRDHAWHDTSVTSGFFG